MKVISSLSVGTLALALLAGCSTFDQQTVSERTEPTRESPTQVTQGYDTLGRKWGEGQAPAERPAPAAPARTTTADHSATELKTGLVTVLTRVPGSVALGEEYAVDIAATAMAEVGNVVITQTLPDGATYVRSEPPGTKDGNQITWRFPAMHKGDTRNLRVYLKADKEGELATCASVTATPLSCASTFVGKPLLAIDKTGPDTALLNSEVKYNIMVSNKGTTPARNVVVTDAVPEGLAAPSGQKELSFTVGDLGPNQSRNIPVVLKAAKRGKFCNSATAVAANVGKVTDEVCTTVVEPGLDIVKTGDKEQFLGRVARYTVVVTNTGDTTLTGVAITDTAPEPTTIVAAEGATVRGTTATWNLAELKAREARSFTVSLTSKQAGNYCNSVTAATASGLRDSAQACTVWRGVSAILIEMVDDPDPIQVGETTTYTIRVTNQGTADDNNIGMVASFGAEIAPVSATQGATISGGTVTFPKVPTLAPKQVVTYSIVAKAAKTGDHRLKVSLTSDVLKTPVVEEESTNVY